MFELVVAANQAYFITLGLCDNHAVIRVSMFLPKRQTCILLQVIRSDRNKMYLAVIERAKHVTWTLDDIGFLTNSNFASLAKVNKFLYTNRTRVKSVVVILKQSSHII